MIGQIVNCPKCNSMLMVTAPEPIYVEAPGSQPVDSMAMTKEGIAPEPAPDLEGAEPQQDSQHDSASPDGVHPLAREEEAAAEEASAGDAPPVTRPSGQTAIADWSSDDAPLLPSEQWTSASTARTRQYLLVGFLGVSGIALATVAFFAFLRWYPQSSPGPAIAMPSPEADEPPDPASPPGETIGEVVSDRSTDSPSTDPQAGGDDEPRLDALPPETEAGDGLDSTPTSPVPPDPEETESGSNADVGELPEALVQDDVETASVDEAGPPQQNLPKALEAFGPMLNWKVQLTLPDEGVELSAPPLTAEELGLDTGQGQTVAIQPVDLTAHSQTELPGLIIGENQPLSQVINLWTSISGVPSVVDLDSLAAANIDRDQSAAVGKVQRATIAEVASLLGQSFGAEVVPRENRFLVFRAAATEMKRQLPDRVSLTGLVDDAAGEQWLTETLRRLFPQHADGWTIADGKITYDEKQVDLMTWFFVIRLLENWRSVQGLPTSLDGYDPARVVTDFPNPAELAALDHELTEPTVMSRPVGQVLSRVCEEAGIHCWIDWPHVADVGLGPSTTELVVTNARPLRRVLANYAQRFSLVVAMIDDHSLWLTTPQAYRAQPQLYVLPSEGLTPEQWQQKLRPFTPAGPDGIGTIDVIPTPDTKFLFVRCCRPVVNF